MTKISRRKLLKLAGVAPVASAFSSAWMSKASAAGKKTITAVMHSDLRIIDPLFTTAYITRDHGYMVFDTLLATDSNFKVQPQMADGTKSRKMGGGLSRWARAKPTPIKSWHSCGSVIFA